ncbi:MAG: hypothetical protein V6015_00575 [Candidatus Dasytiphilus stammeri]
MLNTKKLLICISSLIATMGISMAHQVIPTAINNINQVPINNDSRLSSIIDKINPSIVNLLVTQKNRVQTDAVNDTEQDEIVDKNNPIVEQPELSQKDNKIEEQVNYTISDIAGAEIFV